MVDSNPSGRAAGRRGEVWGTLGEVSGREWGIFIIIMNFDEFQKLTQKNIDNRRKWVYDVYVCIGN